MAAATEAKACSIPGRDSTGVFPPPLQPVTSLTRRSRSRASEEVPGPDCRCIWMVHSDAPASFSASATRVCVNVLNAGLASISKATMTGRAACCLRRASQASITASSRYAPDPGREKIR
jgi:hypothetical protein